MRFFRLSPSIGPHFIPEISYFRRMGFHGSVSNSIGRGASHRGGNSSSYRPKQVWVEGQSCDESLHDIDGNSDNRYRIFKNKVNGINYRYTNHRRKSNIRKEWRPCYTSKSSKLDRIVQPTDSVEAEGTQPKHGEASSGTVSKYDKDFPSLGSHRNFGKRRTRIDLGLEQEIRSGTGNVSSSKSRSASPMYSAARQDSPVPAQFEKMSTSFKGQRDFAYDDSSEHANPPESVPKTKPFDICLSKNSRMKRVNYSLPKSRELQNQIDKTVNESTQIILRPGMVLLKHFINLKEQVNIVKKCQQLGIGPGGFYQPGYQDGAKLCLQMMCLGLNWEPETRKYDNTRSFDGCEPPPIPHEFSLLVRKSINDAHDLIKKDSGVGNVEDILPGMSPDICIVNFYNTSGRLGLHQDRDESRQSLSKGLPVVSFSIGDSAEFLYGDQRYLDKAEKVLLESGDVLIFGGKSRHVFHGVSAIIPQTAPQTLLNKVMLQPGRLNLTFRQF